MTKTGTFTMIGFAAARRPDGSFMPSVPLYVEGEAGTEFATRMSRVLRELYETRDAGKASGGAA